MLTDGSTQLYMRWHTHNQWK